MFFQFVVVFVITIVAERASLERDQFELDCRFDEQEPLAIRLPTHDHNIAQKKDRHGKPGVDAHAPSVAMFNAANINT
jgi:hypothetical protein